MKRPKRKKKTGRRTWRNDVVRYTRLSCLVAAGGGSAGASRCTSSDLRETLLVSEPPADLPRGGFFVIISCAGATHFQEAPVFPLPVPSSSRWLSLAGFAPPQPPPRPPVHKKQQQSIVCTTLESSHAKTTR